MSNQQKIKSTEIKVSVIIISYNVKKYLIQCLESILIHTNTKFKYEIIDDCNININAIIMILNERKAVIEVIQISPKFLF